MRERSWVVNLDACFPSFGIKVVKQSQAANRCINSIRGFQMCISNVNGPGRHKLIRHIDAISTRRPDRCAKIKLSAPLTSAGQGVWPRRSLSHDTIFYSEYSFLRVRYDPTVPEPDIATIQRLQMLQWRGGLLPRGLLICLYFVSLVRREVTPTCPTRTCRSYRTPERPVRSARATFWHVGVIRM